MKKETISRDKEITASIRAVASNLTSDTLFKYFFTASVLLFKLYVSYNNNPGSIFLHPFSQSKWEWSEENLWSSICSKMLEMYMWPPQTYVYSEVKCIWTWYSVYRRWNWWGNTSPSRKACFWLQRPSKFQFSICLVSSWFCSQLAVLFTHPTANPVNIHSSSFCHE